jgi:hypothetical protein
MAKLLLLACEKTVAEASRFSWHAGAKPGYGTELELGYDYYWPEKKKK